jgi:hypothetical protein
LLVIGQLRFATINNMTKLGHAKQISLMTNSLSIPNRFASFSATTHSL